MNRLRRDIPILLVLLMVIPLTFGGNPPCPEQPYLPLTGYPVTLDLAKIAYDRNDPADPNYATRKQLLVAILPVALGNQAAYEGYACDADGDSLIIKAQDGTLTALTGGGEPVPQTPVDGYVSLVAGGRYRWIYTPMSLGVSYHDLEVSDVRPGTTDARSTRGTIVVIAIPRNAHAPSLCGGQPR
jgi:hypothetical protein